MPDLARQLNDYVGALLLAATVALSTNAIIAYGSDKDHERRIITLEKFQEQQYDINKTLHELAKTVAVLQAQR